MSATLATAALGHLIGGTIDHLGIAVPDLTAATAFYRDVLGMEEVRRKVMVEDGLAVTFMLAPTPGLSIELISPLAGAGELTGLLGDHTVQAFLRGQPRGGLHHVCFQTHDFAGAKRSLEAAGGAALGNRKGAIGASGRPVMFFAPTFPSGILVEVKEVPRDEATSVTS